MDCYCCSMWALRLSLHGTVLKGFGVLFGNMGWRAPPMGMVCQLNSVLCMLLSQVSVVLRRTVVPHCCYCSVLVRSIYDLYELHVSLQ